MSVSGEGAVSASRRGKDRTGVFRSRLAEVGRVAKQATDYRVHFLPHCLPPILDNHLHRTAAPVGDQNRLDR
jgi:hypothetical protein